MGYKLIITQRAEELLDGHVSYLIFCIKNRQAAGHLLNQVENLYDRLEQNPYQFPECRDEYLKRKGYREAVVSEMHYLVIFKVVKEHVFVLGVFHELENYNNKL